MIAWIHGNSPNRRPVRSSLGCTSGSKRAVVVLQQVAGQHRSVGELVEQRVVGALGELVGVGAQDGRPRRAPRPRAAPRRGCATTASAAQPSTWSTRCAARCRVGGLERVVPVAVAVCRQRAPRDRASPRSGGRLHDGGARPLWPASAEGVVADEGLTVSSSRLASPVPSAGSHPAARTGQKTTSPCESCCPVSEKRRQGTSKACGQSPRAFWARKTRSSTSRTCVLLGRAR